MRQSIDGSGDKKMKTSVMMKIGAVFAAAVAAVATAAPAADKLVEDQDASESVHYGYHHYHPGHHYREEDNHRRGFQCGSYRYCAYR